MPPEILVFPSTSDAKYLIQAVSAVIEPSKMLTTALPVDEPPTWTIPSAIIVEPFLTAFIVPAVIVKVAVWLASAYKPTH